MYDKKITVIFKYLTQLKQTISLQDKFYILMNMAKELVEVDRCTIWRYDPISKVLIAKFAHGIETELREPIEAGVVGHCFTNQETLVIEDAKSSELFDAHIDSITGYDTQNIIRGAYETPIEGAIALYLDFLNLFVSLLQTLGIFGSKDE